MRSLKLYRNIVILVVLFLGLIGAYFAIKTGFRLKKRIVTNRLKYTSWTRKRRKSLR